MLKDITFGQYFPSNSVIHRLDPRFKFLGLIFLLVAFIAFVSNFYSLGLALVFCVFIILLSKVPIKMYLKNLKMILPVIVFTAILNSLYTSGGREWSFWIFTVSSEGLKRAAFMSIRVVLLIVISAVLTYTTTANDLTDAIESICSPLRFIGLGRAVHVLTLMMTIALRFIPILIEETGKIINAQKARGSDFESGGFIKRIKALIPILIPLIILSVRRAYDLAEAMECRCYNGGIGRKRMKKLAFGLNDLMALFVFAIGIAGIIFLEFFVG